MFTGIWTALATPFNEDFSIDWVSFEKLVEHQKNKGIKGLIISGSTGESTSLSVQEKLSLVRKARSLVNGSMGIMAATGGSNTQQSVELSKLAVEAGADSLLVVTPPYTKPHIDGLVAHFTEITTSVQVPVCLYHVPGRTGYKLSPEDIQKICAVDGVEGVKEASGDLRLFAVARRLAQVPFLSGDDTTFLPSLSIDGHGCISVISNVCPSEMVNMQNLFQAGNWYEAYSIYNKILPLMELLASNNPSPLKAALSVKGLCKNILRLPMTPVSERVYKAIAGELS